VRTKSVTNVAAIALSEERVTSWGLNRVVDKVLATSAKRVGVEVGFKQGLTGGSERVKTVNGLANEEVTRFERVFHGRNFV